MGHGAPGQRKSDSGHIVVRFTDGFDRFGDAGQIVNRDSARFAAGRVRVGQNAVIFFTIAAGAVVVGNAGVTCALSVKNAGFLGTAQIVFESSTIEEAEDVCECLKVLYSTRAGELGLDRDFGISMDAVDRPIAVAKALISAEIVRKTKRYETRVEVTRIEWDDSKVGEGILIPKVVLQSV